MPSSYAFAQSNSNWGKSEKSEKIAEANPQIGKASRENDLRPIKREIKTSKPVTADWTTMPSTYSHDQTGQRVDQYAAAVEPQSMERSDFVRSGYRHTRSSLQAGFSSDHYHVTEQWGQPVRPYGEWRYPNRPFSVPYGQWGPQLPQVVVGGNQLNFPGLGGFYSGHSGNHQDSFNWNGTHGQGMNGQNSNGSQNLNVGPGVGTGPNPGFGQWPIQPGFNIGGPANAQWYGQNSPNNNTGVFGVGPNNTLPSGQDEYYQQAPTYHPLNEGGFQSPFRN